MPKADDLERQMRALEAKIRAKRDNPLGVHPDDDVKLRQADGNINCADAELSHGDLAAAERYIKAAEDLINSTIRD